MKLWKNTKTLDGLVDDLEITEDKDKAEVALLGSKPIILEELPNLRGIFRAGVSKSNVPIEEATKKGIKVRFPSKETTNYIYEETANYTCNLIFRMFYQDVGTLDPWVKFNRKALQDKNLLIIGMGNIGKKVAPKMAMVLNIYTWDIQKDKEFDLKNHIKKADCITLHIPDVKENINFIDAEKMSWMKDHTIIINTARGPVVSEEALYNELKTGRLKAAFDVYWQEPYNGKLKDFYPDRFFMSPHIASTCDEFLQGSANELRLLIKELEE